MKFRTLVFLWNDKGHRTHPMIVRWHWHTIDSKKIKLISRYYKRTAKRNPQTIHLRVWLLTFHLRKRNFPGATPLPTGFVDPARDFTDHSAVSSWASSMLTWTRTPKANSCAGAQKHHEVSKFWAKYCLSPGTLHPMLGPHNMHRLHLIVK